MSSQRFSAGSIPHLSALAYEIISRFPKGAPLLCLNQEIAEGLRDELQFFLEKTSGLNSSQNIHILQSLDIEAHTQRRPALSERKERLRFFYHLQKNPESYFIWTLPALLEKGLHNPFQNNKKETLLVNQKILREALLKKLTALGYEEAEVVEIPGQFAARGSVLDIYSFIDELPVRIDLNEDCVQSISSFDPQTQLREETLSSFEILPARDFLPENVSSFRSKIRTYMMEHSYPSEQKDSVSALLSESYTENKVFPLGFELWSFLEKSQELSLSLIAKNPIIIDPNNFFQKWRLAINQSEKKLQLAQSVGDIAPLPGDFFHGSESSTHFLKILREESSALSFQATDGIHEKYSAPSTTSADLSRLSSLWKSHQVESFAKELLQEAADLSVLFVFHSVSQMERLEFLLSPYGIHFDKKQNSLPKEKGFHWTIGNLQRSFRVPSQKLFIISEADILGTTRSTKRRSSQVSKSSKEIFFRDIREGDMVVHATHGIGQYLGLKTLHIQGRSNDLIELLYKDGKVYVPVQQLRQIHRYSGAEVSDAQMDKLGGTTWKNKKEKVKKEILAFAGELLTLYAQRSLATGLKLSPSIEKIQEFAASFPYDETPDQEKAISSILQDLESGHPMDRLLCGDVGYGKTEVALRATHAVISSGYQVAVLSPTTLLTAQHERLFKTRLGEFGYKVAALSRFNTEKESREIIEKIKTGEIDVVVGTHRLLSTDVSFKKLGLIVIDEEQRFGVIHKEKLKRMRTNVHVLSMTATPIPRTLSMAMSGLREFSVMTTPPQDRLSVKTHVLRKNGILIKDAIEFETKRGGQVFYLFNRVRGIEKAYEELSKYVPDIKIDFAHGQMDETVLEDKMIKFYRGETQVLVTTTIIEAGLDVSNANTLIVENAANFGLSQLYQLRGRVGRSDRKAYAYLLLPETGSVSPEAEQRLGILELYQDLGSGFTIASHDLDLRGAGEVLGDSQSGHMSLIGSESYFELLQETIAELKGEALERDFEPEIQLTLDTAIPENYIKEIALRLSIYRRFSSAANEEAVDQIVSELDDRFGTPPLSVLNLSKVMKIVCVLRRLRIRSFASGKSGITVVFDASSPLSREKLVERALKYPKHFQLSPDGKLLIKNPTNEQPNEESLLKSVDSALSQFETLI